MRIYLVILCVYFSSICNAAESNFDTAIATYINGDIPKYEVAYYDLNSDGFQDAFVYLNDRNWCGSGGCTSLIFKGTKSKFVFTSKVMIVKKPIVISTSNTHNWFDIIVNTGVIGSVILKSDGQRYPLNPSRQPKASSTQTPKGHYLFK